MLKSLSILGSGAIAASLLIANPALALNPQPEPPSKSMKQSKSLGGPDTKALKRGKGGGAGEKGIILQSPGKGGAGEKGIILQNPGK